MLTFKTFRRLTDAQRDLVEAYLRLAYAMARRGAILYSFVSLEDLRDAAIDGLLRAASHYDPTRSQHGYISFATFARMVIRQRLVRAATLVRREVIRRRPMLRPEEVVDRPAETQTRPIDPELLDRLGRILTRRQNETILARHVEGVPVKVIAHRFGVSHQGVRCILQQAYARVRRKAPELAPA